MSEPFGAIYRKFPIVFFQFDFRMIIHTNDINNDINSSSECEFHVNWFNQIAGFQALSELKVVLGKLRVHDGCFLKGEAEKIPMENPLGRFFFFKFCFWGGGVGKLIRV